MGNFYITLMRLLFCIFILLFLACGKQEKAIVVIEEKEEPDYGFYEDKRHGRLYECLDKECNEKRLILYDIR